jgi:dihydrofolate reductase
MSGMARKQGTARIRYLVAMSLDGFIAGPQGEADWITSDPEIDFAATFAQFDTAVMGRKTYEQVIKAGYSSLPGMRTVVCSRALQPSDHSGISILNSASRESIAPLKAASRKDIWLFGGAVLFRDLASENLVDTVEVSVIPIVLGSGVPLIADTADRIRLLLTGHEIYKTGIVRLEYAVLPRYSAA